MSPSSFPHLCDYQAKYYANELVRSHSSDHVGKIAGLLFDAQIDPQPHQIDAALFALDPTAPAGAMLADEVGLGKTIEAGIVIAQYWAQQKRRVLIVVPSSLRQQWRQELLDKFMLPARILDRLNRDELLAAAAPETILICSYEFSHRNIGHLEGLWDLVVIDEAHRLRSYWQEGTRSTGKIAKSVAKILGSAEKKLLLTATPLQNRVEEIYGLVQAMDPGFFSSLGAFQSRYAGKEPQDLLGLSERLSPVLKRTLREDAEPYIRFTERIPLTVEFAPTPKELELYEKVDEYLTGSEVLAYPPHVMPLMSMTIRKRLGSSTHAVASTLRKTAARLKAELAGAPDDSIADEAGGADLTGEEAEALIETGCPKKTPGPRPAGAVAAEIDSLESMAALAESITENKKAAALVQALELGFEKMSEIGAPQKALIFTDNVVTQNYLLEYLKTSPWADGLVPFNGANDSPLATDIYQGWLEQNTGSDRVTGVSQPDRRRALVDYFRDEGQIMIATEAAAEGLNLQFCSLIINYDLPWNPQRVEQRIGRSHRYGQKHNVVVVNFFNKKNRAEQRILELLEKKFRLFEGVFGASSTVLGQLESGFDFQKKISQILQQCRTEAEIDAAFNRLEREFAAEIDAAMRETSEKILAHLDPSVRDKLRRYEGEISEVLTRFEQILWALTATQLHERAAFTETGRSFDLYDPPEPSVPRGVYHFKSDPHRNARQYRFEDPLAQWVVGRSLRAPTPPASLTFDFGSSARASSLVKHLRGQSGFFTLGLAEFELGKRADREAHFITAGEVDTGEELTDEQVYALLELTSTGAAPLTEAERQAVSARAASPAIQQRLEKQLETFSEDILVRTTTKLSREEEHLQQLREDTLSERNTKIEELEKQAEIERKKAPNLPAVEATLAKRKSERLRRRAGQMYETYREALAARDKEIEDALDALEGALRMSLTTEELFTVRWQVT